MYVETEAYYKLEELSKNIDSNGKIFIASTCEMKINKEDLVADINVPGYSRLNKTKKAPYSAYLKILNTITVTHVSSLSD